MLDREWVQPEEPHLSIAVARVSHSKFKFVCVSVYPKTATASLEVSRRMKITHTHTHTDTDTQKATWMEVIHLNFPYWNSTSSITVSQAPSLSGRAASEFVLEDRSWKTRIFTMEFTVLRWIINAWVSWVIAESIASKVPLKFSST